MTSIQNQTFDQERALYGREGLSVTQCRFDGPADGESAFKECRDIRVSGSFFNLRYPFWHDDSLEIENCQMTELCRAALWYSHHVRITNSRLHGIKALRECGDVEMTDCDVVSAEFGWSTRGIKMTGCSVQSEYFMLRSEGLRFTDVRLKGKYSFQYIEDAVLEGCYLDTKDAFWHAKNVTIRNSVVKGEYLAWYSENVTFENCTIIGTQPLCYCKGLKLIHCQMNGTDLCFEKSEVEATVISAVASIKNPRRGYILASSVGETIFDDPGAQGTIVTASQDDSEKARQLLAAQGYTCVLCKQAQVYTTGLRGVRPLMQWLEQGTSLTGFSAADKVVGKATAFLYCLLGVTSVFAQVMSRTALEVLRKAGIQAQYEALTDYIVNRQGDGICPFEGAVLDVHTPQEALPAIYEKMKELGMTL